ncbi:MAG: 5'-nucleotidase C-terminal domain-containing protein [Gemmatimonadota bacterium]
MRRALTPLLLALLTTFPASVEAQGRASQRTVTFIHFNDIYEITPMAGGSSGGLARLATLRAALARQYPNTVTDLAGDFLSPSAMGLAKVDGSRLAGRQMVSVLNAVGLQWATFGNHEFDIRPEEFLARLSESRFTYVVSNVTDSTGVLFPHTQRHAILRFGGRGGGLRIGLIGLVINDNHPVWTRFEDPIVAAQREVAQLRDSVDAIVAITHLTLATDQRLVESVPEIALVLGGHEHENYEIRRGARFTPIVKADANVRSVAAVTLNFRQRGARPDVSVRLIVLDSTIRPDPRVARLVATWVARSDSAYIAAGLDPHARVTTLPAPFDGKESTVRVRPAPLAQMIAEALRAEVPGAEVGVMNSGSIRIDDVIPAGPVTQYDVIRILPFGGAVVGTTMSGSLLGRVLDQGEANRGTGGYLQFVGAERVGDHWVVGGSPLDPTRQYRVASTDFLLTGAERGLGFLAPGNPELGPITSYRDIRKAVIDRLRAVYGN